MAINNIIKYLRLGVKYLSTAAINLYDVVAILNNIGYSSVVKLPPPRFRRGLGGEGPIAVKGEVIVDVNTERHILGVSAREPELLISEFNIIEETLSNRLRGYKEPQFYELLSEVETSVEGVDFYSLIEEKLDLSPLPAISKCLGIDACLIGFRVGKKGARPEDDEWLELEVTPSFLKSNGILYMSLIYRSKNKDKVLNITKRVSELSSFIAKSLL